jgi:hypothetical protein
MKIVRVDYKIELFIHAIEEKSELQWCHSRREAGEPDKICLEDRDGAESISDDALVGNELVVGGSTSEQSERKKTVDVWI